MNPVVSKIQTLGKQVVPKDSRLVLFGSRARGDFRIEKARRAFEQAQGVVALEYWETIANRL